MKNLYLVVYNDIHENNFELKSFPIVQESNDFFIVTNLNSNTEFCVSKGNFSAYKLTPQAALSDFISQQSKYILLFEKNIRSHKLRIDLAKQELAQKY